MSEDYLYNIPKHLEKEYILNMLIKYEYNKDKVSKILGIGIMTLYAKMSEYKLFKE